MSSKKIIVTNIKAIRSKHGNSGWNSIQKAVNDLIDKDANRGISTSLIGMDLQSHMKKINASAVRDHQDPKQNKTAIDAVHESLQPDYIMILGAPDIVPHQPLRNPIPDGDPAVPSDLPYACNAAFSRKAENFKGPTRVVGRLPDVNGNRDPQYLVNLLETAANWRPGRRRAYENYFAISADVWKGSTRMSVKKLFGTTRSLQLSPPKGPNWTKQQLQSMLHFINLHGASEDPNYYGEGPGSVFPIAHKASHLNGRMRTGSVVAAECCYGAEFYDPDFFAGEQGICNAAMAAGAFGFLGSTTIAYGPANGNGAADLICQFFFRELLKGASLGRALLQARQQYINGQAPLDPTDLKTIAQFFLAGDPSIHPVKVAANVFAKGPQAKSWGTRKRRRKTLFQKGLFLMGAIAGTYSKADLKLDEKLTSSLMSIAKDLGLVVKIKPKSFAIHGASNPTMAKSLPAKRKAAGEGAYHLMVAKVPAAKPKSIAKSVSKVKGNLGRIQDTVLIVVKELDGIIEEVKELHAR